MTPDTILVIEDREDDVVFLKVALRRAELTLPLEIARSGEDGLKILMNCVEEFKRSGQLVLPLCVLLDLKLPGLNGFEVLERMRAIPELGKLLTIVLTGSEQESDVIMAYQLGARSYIVKPPSAVDLKAMVNAVKSISSPEWLQPAILPGIKNPAR